MAAITTKFAVCSTFAGRDGDLRWFEHGSLKTLPEATEYASILIRDEKEKSVTIFKVTTEPVATIVDNHEPEVGDLVEPDDGPKLTGLG